MRALLLLGLVLLAAAPTPVRAQDPTAPVRALPADELDPTLLEQTIQEVRSDASLSESDRERILDLYNQALAQLSLERDFEQQLAEGERTALEAPALLESIQAELGSELPPLELELPPGMTTAQMELRLTQVEADRASEEDLSQGLEEEQSFQSERRSVLPALLADARNREEALAVELDAVPSPPETMEDRALGVAGPFIGRVGDLLLVAGGANFPRARPWRGGEKVWWDRIRRSLPPG